MATFANTIDAAKQAKMARRTFMRRAKELGVRPMVIKRTTGPVAFWTQAQIEQIKAR